MEPVFVLTFVIIAWLFFKGGLIFFEKTYKRWVRIFDAEKSTSRFARIWMYVIFLTYFVVALVFFLAFATFVQAVAISNGWNVAIVCGTIWFYAADKTLEWFKKERTADQKPKEETS